ncbi:MAG: V-type ATP synthase subunit I [Nanoarchaeota archaeon]|nr:V-type ATP synthase subunit I [Nanoarchaeota archaeon]
MIRPKPMSKVTIFGPKTFMKQVIEKLYDLGAVHIEDFTKKSEEEYFDIGEPYPSNEKNAEVLVKLRTLASLLKLSVKGGKASTTSIDIIEEKTGKLYTQVTDKLSRKDYLARLAKIYSKKQDEKALASLKVDLSPDFNNSNYIHYFGIVNTQFDLLKEEIEKSSPKSAAFSSNYEGFSVVGIFVDAKKKEKVDSILAGYDFSPIEGPFAKKQFPDLASKPATRFVKLGYEAEQVEKKLKQAEFDVQQLIADQSKFIIESERRLTVESEKAEAPLRFATSKNTFLIKGWVPTENLKKMDDQIGKVTDRKVMIKVDKIGKKDNVPVAFNHPKIVEPFEAFMDLYTLPSYKEIDPTFFMFLTFPIFFGFMLGDVGYGLVCLLLFMWLKAKMPGAKHMLNAFIIASVMSVVFGFVYGEYFGIEEIPMSMAVALHSEKLICQPEHAAEAGTHGEAAAESHGEAAEDHGEEGALCNLPRLLQRSHQIQDLLSIAVLFGIVHLMIGFIVGFINVYHAHGFMHAVYEKLGWLMILPLIVWLLMNFLGIIKGYVATMLSVILPQSSLPVLGVMFLIGTVLVVKGEGIRGLIEVVFMSLMSNILSYARLMAVGLASVSLAVVVNDLAGQMFAAGPIGIVGGVLVLIVGHGINIALGILSPFLHALRLHYVEFFNKFFTGGGKRFKAFGQLE